MKKHCNICKKTKPVSDFYRNHKAKDGLAYQCKPCKIEYSKKYRTENLEECRKREKEYARNNRDAKNEAVRRFYKINPDKSKEYNARYMAKPEAKEKQRERARIYMKKKRESCHLQRLRLVCRSRIHIALSRKGLKKTSKTFDTIGCSPEFLASHLENQFKEGMSWDNYGEWHIDHIVPISKGVTKEEILSLSHYTNLQPLWAEENWSKGCRV